MSAPKNGKNRMGGASQKGGSVSISEHHAVGPERLPLRTVGEWVVSAERAYTNPFADVALDAIFTAPSGADLRHPGFYDGDGFWKVRFNPGEAGEWRFRTESRPRDPGLEREGTFVVEPREARGFRRATPGVGWGFSFENGEPVLPFGDTVYHLFAIAHCGGDVGAFLERRARQGFNLLRIRLPVSAFHPPHGDSEWQTRRVFPWGGSEQAPRFDLFNLEYFRTVDAVVHQIDALGLGVELVAEGWGFEFPFNSRHIFVPEWEEQWLRWLVARYDAYASTWFWTPLNEYEYYPNGDWNYQPVADQFQIRLSRWLKANAAHGHVVAAHNGPRLPLFAKRFKAAPEAVDAIMFQEWGSRDEEHGWLAAGIAESIAASLTGWRGDPGRVGLRAESRVRPETAKSRIQRRRPYASRRLAGWLLRPRHHPRVRELVGSVDAAGRGSTGDRGAPPLAPLLPRNRALRQAAAGAGAGRPRLGLGR